MYFSYDKKLRKLGSVEFLILHAGKHLENSVSTDMYESYEDM